MQRVALGLLLAASLLTSAHGQTTAVASLAPQGVLAPLCVTCEVASAITYTDSVHCDAWERCERIRRTVPVDQIIEERIGADHCLQYRQRLVGFRRVPSLDPAMPIEVPQFERERARQVLCEPQRARRALELLHSRR